MLNQIISVSILVLLVILIRSLCGKYIGQRFKYALWLIVAVKLLIPMPFENPINVLNYFPAESNAIIRIVDHVGSETISDMAAENTRQLSSVHTENKKTSPVNNNDVIEKTEAIRPDAGIKDKVSGIQILKWIWIMGIVFFTGYLLVSNLIFSVKLRQERKYIEKYRDALPIYVTSLVPSPCLFGIIKPAIYLPDDWKISGKYRDYILLHEWIHYRHMDMIWALIRSVCLAIYWFHPLVWVSCILSKRDCETACDEGVMAVLGDENKPDYCHMLVDICAMLSKDSKNYLFMQELRGGHREMKTRLSLLIKKSLPMTWMIILAVGISVGAAGCTFGTGTVADTDSNDEKGQLTSTDGRKEEAAINQSIKDDNVEFILQDYIYSDQTRSGNCVFLVTGLTQEDLQQAEINEHRMVGGYRFEFNSASTGHTSLKIADRGLEVKFQFSSGNDGSEEYDSDEICVYSNGRDEVGRFDLKPNDQNGHFISEGIAVSTTSVRIASDVSCKDLQIICGAKKIDVLKNGKNQMRSEYHSEYRTIFLDNPCKEKIVQVKYNGKVFDVA